MALKTYAERDEGQWWVYQGADMTGPYPSEDAARLAVPFLVCDEDYEKITGLFAECADVCSLSLDHDGLCRARPRASAQTFCDVCGETGRLTEVDPREHY